MPRGERAAGPGFEIAFELERPRLSRKCDHDDHPPRFPAARVPAAACIVLRQSRSDVRGDAAVVTRCIRCALKNVDEALFGHGHDGVQERVHPESRGNRVGCSLREHARCVRSIMVNAEGTQDFTGPPSRLRRYGGHHPSLVSVCSPDEKRATPERVGGLPSEARPTGERRMVDQNSASWNPLFTWLGQVETLMRSTG
jgi:hypothetical protein